VWKLLIKIMALLTQFVAGKASDSKLSQPSASIAIDSDNELTVSWGAITNAEQYKVHVSIDSVFGGGSDLQEELIVILDSSETSYLIDNLLPASTRYVRVKALAKNFNDSEWSATKSATTTSNSPVYLEAECGSIGTSWTITSDGTASNSAYIQPSATSPDNPTGTDASQAQYTFSLNETGLYRFWLLVQIPDQANDSVWASVNGGNFYLSNNMTVGTSWHWVRLQDSNNGGVPIEENLPLGNNTLFLDLRDSGIKIDQIYITKNGDTPSGAGTASNCVVPDDPTNLVLTAVSTSQIDISWTDASTNENSWEIEWSADGVSGWTSLQDARLTSYSHTSLSTNTEYFYRVSAINHEGVSGYLAGSVSTLDTTQLGTPTLVWTILGGDYISIRVDNHPIADYDSYTFEYDTDSGFGSATSASQASENYTASGLSLGTTYYFRAKATGSGFVDSAWSDTLTQSTSGAPTQLPTPTNLSATGTDTDEITASWNAVTGATSYTYQIDTDPAFGSPTETTGYGSTSIVIGSLSDSTVYYFRVKAVNGVDDDSLWATTNATTQSPSSTPGIYYVSPSGNNTNPATNTRNNPAHYRFFADDPAGYTVLVPGDQVWFITDQGPYVMDGGFRILATGTAANPILYRAEPGKGLAHFRISRFNESDFRSLIRYQNPNGISIGGEWYSTGPLETQWNKRDPEQSVLGNYCYVMGFITEGQYKQNVQPSDLINKQRDFSSIPESTIEYGDTGARAADTITGFTDSPYDFFSGNIGSSSRGSKILSCVCWHVGQAGTMGFSSAILSTDVESAMCVSIGTGHAGNDGKDHGHNRYLQHRSDAQGYFYTNGDTMIGSAEEQMQCWAQTGVVNPYQPGEYSKVDKFRIIDCIAAHGGGLSGQAYPNSLRRNMLFGGYTFEEDSQIIGYLSYHKSVGGGRGIHNGYSLNGNNERRNVTIKNCYIQGVASHLTLFNAWTLNDVSGNTFVSGIGLNGQGSMAYDVSTARQTDFENDLTNVSNNDYYTPSGSLSTKIIFYKTWTDPSTQASNNGYTLAEWQAAFTGSESGSRHLISLPQNFERIKRHPYINLNPNMFLKGTLFNHQMDTTWSIDIFDTDGLSPGDQIAVVDLQNMSADGTTNRITTHTFTGPTSDTVTFTIPDENAGVAQDPTGEMINYEHSTIEWCHVAFIKV
jgi:hypothetical protein